MYQQGNLFEPQGASRVTQSPAPHRPAPRPPALLIELPPWRRIFFSNLLDTILRVRPVQPLISARPAPFWPDVFVERPIPWRRMRQSAVFHVLIVSALVALGEMWLRPGPQVRTDFDRSQVTYYPVSDYLPALDTGSTPRPEPRRGEPAYARQQMVSVPPLHDNTHQTIITPDQIKLPADVSLPNLVSWTAMPGPAPAEAIADRTATPHLAETVVAPPPDASRAASRLVAPALPVDVAPPPPDALRAQARQQTPSLAATPVAPPPDATRRYRMRLPNIGEVTVIEPPPALRDLHDRVQLPNMAMPDVIPPPVTARGVAKLGSAAIAHLDTQVAAPPPPMRIRSGAGAKARRGRAVAPPPPEMVAGAAHAANPVGQIIALGLNPAPPGAPIIIPAGRRYGEFAATPEGKPGAPGTPDIKAGTDAAGNDAARSTLPPGISVAPAPAQPASGDLVAANMASPAPAPAAPISAVNRALLAASAMPLKVGDIARQTRPGGAAPAISDPDPINREVFGARQYYTMQLNMPNLTSAAGSWIIRFAELDASAPQGDLIAPAVTLKVDPKYPPEAVRSRLEGVVVLYAVIRKDGSVGQVRVLHGIDSQLDANACTALQHWRFRPALKNGAAVDLEAVVQIPFQARRISF